LTNGILIVDGQQTFDCIPMGGNFELSVLVNSSSSMGEPTAPSPENAPTSRSFDPGTVLAMTGIQLFGAYLVADYSGAIEANRQRRAIKVALATDGEPVLNPGTFTRIELVAELFRQLTLHTEKGTRLLLGVDHQFSIPMALASELGLAQLPWREAISKLYSGEYGPAGPQWGHPQQFAAKFNDFLQNRGAPDYFWSATKHQNYNLRCGTNPRPGNENFRLTELCRSAQSSASPKPLSRLGDNGSVGNQTCCGLQHLLQLVHLCEQAGIPLAVWPMDGIDLTSEAYENRHVLMEPYPSAKRPDHIQQSDSNDAIESARFLRDQDHRGALQHICNLSSLSPEEVQRVQFEGWIVSHLPWNRI